MGTTTNYNTTTTSNIGPSQQPYYNTLMQGAQSLLTTQTPLYDRDRLEGFTPEQRQVQQNILNQQTPGQYGTASNLATSAGIGALQAGQYATGQFNAQQIGQPSLQQYSMGAVRDVQGQQYGTPQMQTAQAGAAPNLNYYQMQQPGNVQGTNVQSQNMQAAQTGYQPNLTNYQMGAARDVSAQNVQSQDMQAAQSNYRPNLQTFQMEGPQQFGSAQAQQYMSPFQQSVVDIQKREAMRDAKKGQLVEDLGSARQGTYGGSRQLLASLERERNLGTQLGDIQARGSQAAYENAQQQFERDRAARMTTGQQNLAAQLGVQELGAQQGLQVAMQNLSNQQQAAVNNQAQRFQAEGMNADNALRAALANQGVDVTRATQNLAANLQTQQLGAQTGTQLALANLSNEQQARVNNQAQEFQAQGMNAQQAMQAALANQQAQLTTGQQNLAANLQTQQLGTQTSTQRALANLDAASQANVQNLSAQLQTQGLNADQALRAALANQQSDITRGTQNLNAALETQRLGATTGLEALRANQTADLEAQRLGEQSRQFGSQQGLAGLSQANQSAQTLANIGSAQSQSDLARFGMQNATAAQQQAFLQQMRDMDYQDFLYERDDPYRRLQQYGNLMSGVPQAMTSTSTQTAPSPGIAQQILGAGLGAYSTYRTFAGA